MDKRQIIRDKSVYKRKKWNLLDAIQFAFIEGRLKTTDYLITSNNLRPLVRKKLEDNGRYVKCYRCKNDSQFWYNISK